MLSSEIAQIVIGACALQCVTGNRARQHTTTTNKRENYV